MIIDDKSISQVIVFGLSKGYSPAICLEQKATFLSNGKLCVANATNKKLVWCQNRTLFVGRMTIKPTLREVIKSFLLFILLFKMQMNHYHTKY